MSRRVSLLGRIHPTPTTRGHHALWWVLGVAVVFAVVMLVGLQMAERRAAEEWERALLHLQAYGWEALEGDLTSEAIGGSLRVEGNYLRSLRSCQLFKGGSSMMAVDQARVYFGRTMTGYVFLDRDDGIPLPTVEALLEEAGIEVGETQVR